MPTAKPTGKFRFFFSIFLSRSINFYVEKKCAFTILTSINHKKIKTQMFGLSKHAINVGFMQCAQLFQALSLRRITVALFVYQGVVSKHNKLSKIDFPLPLTLMVYHRKMGTFIKKEVGMACRASIKDLI